MVFYVDSINLLEGKVTVAFVGHRLTRGGHHGSREQVNGQVVAAASQHIRPNGSASGLHSSAVRVKIQVTDSLSDSAGTGRVDYIDKFGIAGTQSKAVGLTFE